MNLGYKEVTYKHLTVGQRIDGTTEPGRMRLFIAYVKSINPAYVTVTLWNPDGPEEQIESSVMFIVELVRKEFEKKYLTRARDVYSNIQNRLAEYEIGTHEMWNGWLSGDPYEMAQDEEKDGFKIIGHCTDITPKASWFGDPLDIGVCIEYDDGERYWCHWRMSHINEMLELYKEALA